MSPSTLASAYRAMINIIPRVAGGRADSCQRITVLLIGNGILQPRGFGLTAGAKGRGRLRNSSAQFPCRAACPMGTRSREDRGGA